MKLWKTDEINANKICNQISQIYGIKNPEKIQGYNGYFNFCFGEIWIDDNIEYNLKSNSNFEELLEDLLIRFQKDDYGNITSQEKENNLLNKYFFGTFIGLIGKYETIYGALTIEISDKNATTLKLIRA